VVSFKENLIYVLDSLPGNDQRTVIQSIVSTLLKYFEESRAGCEYGIDLSKYKFYVPLVKKQGNRYSSALPKCSLLLLLTHFCG